MFVKCYILVIVYSEAAFISRKLGTQNCSKNFNNIFLLVQIKKCQGAHIFLMFAATDAVKVLYKHSPNLIIAHPLPLNVLFFILIN